MTLSAIFFGSIGTLVETSERQRAAFNRAFLDSGLDWNWDRAAYQAMLARSGGADRIATYAESKGVKVDVAELHRLKTLHFNADMDAGGLMPREGVLDIMRYAVDNGIKTGFVTSTSNENIDTTFKALGNTLTRDDFDIVCDASMVTASKPAPDIYLHALDKLAVDAADCLAIEDSQPSLEAARAAGIPAIAFPGENALAQDYTGAMHVTQRLDPNFFMKAAA